jgi:hypothetical protein
MFVRGGISMTLCPVALAAGCKKCPVFSVCPLKGVIGDYEKSGTGQSKPRQDSSTDKKDPS